LIYPSVEREDRKMKRILVVVVVFSMAMVGCNGEVFKAEGEYSIKAVVSDRDPTQDKCDKPEYATLPKCAKRFVRGDVNNDGELTRDDLPLFKQALRNAEAHICPAVLDTDVDGKLSQADLPVFQSGLREYLNGGELPWKDDLSVRRRDCRSVL
jgi:hypothetical protein